MPRSSMEEVLAAGGEMGRLVQSIDWSATLIGPIQGWPQSLRTAVSICLSCRFPLLICWGPELVMLYNDAYRPILGVAKHPQAMGARVADMWPEIWHVIGPMLEGVLQRGEATYSEDLRLLLDRNGYEEECYFTLSFSPIRGESGEVCGVFTPVTETTQRVLGERRLRTLRQLAEDTSDARTPEEACERAATVIAENPDDLPFALIYLLDGEGRLAQLYGATGLDAGSAAAPSTVDLSDPEATVLATVAKTGQAELVIDALGGIAPDDLAPDDLALDDLALDGPGGVARSALVLPVQQAGQRSLAGLLVAGISPRRALDADYRAFCELVAGHVATAVANARAYDAERQRAEALAELDRQKTAFFSNVSHEFRTPLTLILGPLEDVLADAERPLHPDHREQLKAVGRNATRLLVLVNALLDFSRLEAGRLEAWCTPTDIAGLTAEIASMFRSAAEHAGLYLDIDCPPLAQPVYLDRSMWEKVLLNLLSNALKFTFTGGITVRVRPAGDQVEVTVADTGTGIPPEELPLLFQRFHRVRNARSRTFEGTGIGLALVKELVDMHGGTVEVTSAVGEGSVFTVSIPLGRDHLLPEAIASSERQLSNAVPLDAYLDDVLRWVRAPEVEERAAPPGAGSSRILLVDDNADMREYLTRLLRPHWHVEAVPDGLTALAAAREQLPDLVLTDVMMPGMDGFELLRALREDPRTHRLPVVMLSARAGEAAAVGGLEAGADDYLVKPFSAQELIARIRANLRMAQVRDALARREGQHATVLRGLADAAAALTSAASVDEIIEVITGHARELIGADHAVASVGDGQEWAERSCSAASRDGECAKRDDAHLATLSVIMQGRRRPFRLSREQLYAHPAWPQPREAEGRAGAPLWRSWLAAPLVERDGRRLGLIALSDPREDVFTEQHETILAQLAAMAAVRIENARLFDRAQEVSQTLQRSLMPARLPDVEHVAMSARYFPGTSDMDVGGDWYDVLVLPDRACSQGEAVGGEGAPGGRMLLAVGDVMGHGVQAASTMGQLRNALRAYAWQGMGPAKALEQLNQLMTGLGERHFSTVLCLELHTQSGQLVYATAGHPPPVLLRRGGEAEYLGGGRAAPIGVMPDTRYVESRRRLAPGDTLLLYTDGLIESRSSTLDEGLARLREAMASAPCDLDALIEHVLGTVPHEPRDDDLAILALRVIDRPVLTLERRLEHGPVSLRGMRRELAGFLRSADLDEREIDDLILAISEAAANAIEHPLKASNPSVEVKVEVRGDEVVVDVRDFGQWDDSDPDPDRGRGLSLIHALVDVEVRRYVDGTHVTMRRPLAR